MNDCLDDKNSFNIDQNVQDQLLNDLLPKEWRFFSIERIAEEIDKKGASTELIDFLANTDNYKLKYAISKNSSTSEKVLINIIENSENNYRLNGISDSLDEIARENLYRKKIPIKYKELSEVEIIQILNKDDADEQLLEIFGKYGTVFIREAVAKNPKTPPSTLDLLALDVNTSIQEDVAVNPSCPKESLKKLIKYKGIHDSRVRRAALCNGLSRDWINLIMNDDYTEIRRKLITEYPGHKVINTLLKIDENESSNSFSNKELTACVVFCTNLPKYFLDQISKIDHPNISSAFNELKLPKDLILMSDVEKIEFLKKPDIPVGILEILSYSPNYNIRVAVARSSSTPKTILDVLSKDSVEEVKEAIRELQIPKDWRGLDEEQLIEKIKNNLVDDFIFEFFSKSTNWKVREIIANNPSSPLKILKSLIEDEDEDVKKTAKNNLEKLF